jgi:hypothetical protein
MINYISSCRYQPNFNCVALSLARLGREEAIDPLVDLLDHEEWFRRKQAVWILGCMRAKSAWRDVTRLLDDESGMVRMYAAWALGRLEERGAAESLRRLTDGDESEAVRKEAAAALEQLERGAEQRCNQPRPPWLLVAGDDIPMSDLGGVVITVQDSSDHLWGYTAVSDEAHPLEVLTVPGALVVMRGSGRLSHPGLGLSATIAVTD